MTPRQTILIYSRGFYNNSGDIFEDLKVLLQDNYSTTHSTVADIQYVLVEEFKDILGDSLLYILERVLAEHIRNDCSIVNTTFKAIVSTISKNCKDEIDEEYLQLSIEKYYSIFKDMKFRKQ